ncbi:MAG: TIGR04211 family SH3 domain-containing protein [Sinobacterium sp.]|nr:TIGR04211 family SH3 domain-containing protein [Sinobacterium sp.]
MHASTHSKKKSLLLGAAFTVSLLASPFIIAQDDAASFINKPRYVSDVLYVPMRSGSSNQHRIVHKGLKSGSAVTLLEEANGWSHIKTSRNLDGWMQTRYLLKSPTASLKLIRANKKIDQLTMKSGPMGEKLLAAENHIQQLEQDVKSLEQENNRQSKEFDRVKGLSGDQIRLDRDNKKLYQSNEELRNSLDTVRAENNRLSTKLLSNDIMYGAFAVLLGLVATLGTQHFTRSRKRSEWG